MNDRIELPPKNDESFMLPLQQFTALNWNRTNTSVFSTLHSTFELSKLRTLGLEPKSNKLKACGFYLLSYAPYIHPILGFDGVEPPSFKLSS